MGEIFFALFLFAGMIRGIFGIPINFNILLLGITTIFLVIKVYQNPNILKKLLTPTVLIYSIFVLLTSLSIFYTQNQELFNLKTIKLIVYTTPAFIYPLILFDSKESLTRFLQTIGVISILVSLLLLPEILLRNSSVDHLTLNDASYLHIGRTLSVGFVVLFTLFLNEKNSKIHNFILTISVIIVAFSLLSSGSRMPILSTIVTFSLLIIYLLIDGKIILFKPKNYLFPIISGIVLSLVFILGLWKGYFNTTIYRFSVLIENGGASALTRLEHYNSAISMWLNKPILGYGFASYGDLYFNGKHAYPHNLFLEILAELGLVGFILLILLFILLFIEIVKLIKVKSIRNNYIFIGIISGLIVVFFNSMTSGDINGNRILFAFMSLVFALSLIFKKENSVNRLTNIL